MGTDNQTLYSSKGTAMRHAMWWVVAIAQLALGQRANWSMFLVAGQSNAMGKCGPTRDTVSCIPKTAYEYDYVNNTLAHLRDPVGLPGLNFDRAQFGSAWPALAKRYHEVTGDTVVIVPACKDASALVPRADFCCGHWSRGGQLFDQANTKVQRATQLTRATLSGIVWLQGETDAIGINGRLITKKEYEDSLVSLIRRFRTAFNPTLPFYIVRIGTDLNRADSGFKQIRDAQENVAQADQRTMVVYRRTVDFPSLGWMADGIHYSMAGLNDIGKVSADSIAAYEARSSTKTAQSHRLQFFYPARLSTQSSDPKVFDLAGRAWWRPTGAIMRLLIHQPEHGPALLTYSPFHN